MSYRSRLLCADCSLTARRIPCAFWLSRRGFDRYQRSQMPLMPPVAQMYVSGVSTRKVKKITEVLCGLGISRTQVSQLAKGLDEEIAIWRSRPVRPPRPQYRCRAASSCGCFRSTGTRLRKTRRSSGRFSQSPEPQRSNSPPPSPQSPR